MLSRPDAVLVMGPAWHSCGSHQLYKSQLTAYAALGFQNYFLAVSPTAQILGPLNNYWDYYLRMTPDIVATSRGEARLPTHLHRQPLMLLDKLRAKSRTICFIRSLTSKHAIIPASLREFIASHNLRAIHCNHFFNLPLAKRIARLAPGVKVICETQDIQTRHFITSDPKHPYTERQGDYEEYFRDEVRCLNDADEFVHLNDEEFHIFKKAIPDKPHHLIYPSVARQVIDTQRQTDVDFLVVSSANMPNYHSLRWFLDKVWDDDFNAQAKLRIIGNIDYVFQTEKDPLYKRYGDIFQGRVENVGEWYSRARTVIAPVTEGQGISIKTIEALSSGRPFLFSPMALRGFSTDPAATVLSGRCETQDEFRQQIRSRIKQSKSKKAEENTAGLALYQSLFAPESYRKKIANLVQ